MFNANLSYSITGGYKDPLYMVVENNAMDTKVRIMGDKV